MAAASIPTTSEIKTNSLRNKQDENARHPTVEELLIQIENHLYKSIEHRASLLIAVWSCLAGRIGYFRNMEKIFHMLYRESAMTIFCGQWSRVNLLFKRGLSRALIHFSHSMGHYIKGAEGLCSALVMAAYDPWGDPVIHKLLRKEDVEQQSVNDFIKSEPLELLVIRVECLVNARFEEAAIRLCRCCLKSHIFKNNGEDEIAIDNSWRWIFMEWLLRLLFRKGKLNDLVAESEACSCHDGVRLIYRTRSSSLDDSEPLTETLINLFLVRDLLFQSNYCCTSELMSLWCDFQVQKQRTVIEIQYAAQKLLVGHASSSAQFYLFVDILWRKFGAYLLPLYIEMYVRGLTSDLNYLEAARQADNKEYVIELENHMAAMYFKLSSMFNTINKEISLECMLSSFSLDPTKERLDCIKRLSLQISKEKALKAATENESCKHKLYNKSSCAYLHPASVKKKAVIMCDQAIQVGDGLFDDDCELLAPINYTLNKNIDLMNGSSIISGAQNDKSLILKNLSSDKVINAVDKKEKEIGQKEQNEKNCSSEKTKNESMVSVDSNSENVKTYATHKQCSENKESSEIETGELNNINCDDIKNQKYLSNPDFDKHCNCHTSENFLPHNGEIYELPKESMKTGDIDCNDSQSPIIHKAHCRDVHISENIALKELTLKSHSIKENGFASQSDTDSSTSTCKNTVANVGNLDVDNKSDTNQHHNCLNGFDEANRLQDSKHSNKNSEKVANSERNVKVSDGYKKSLAKSDECNTEICEQESSSENNKINSPEITANISVNNEISVKDNSSKCKMNGEINVNSKLLSSVEANDNSQESHPFSHIVLDSKSLGISDDMLSDFVIVLESLRNKQLKSSNKWSQIKHLCEDYLVNVTNSRCIMLNMQLNESVDSEADSISEITTGLKEFESHQSDDSVVEDHCADKSHVFKRFMNSGKNAEMATYVNLSDIHCPQIPLEKLFCTEHSSSHIVHKKRHKKHRNHDKNPEKVVLRKLRHGDHADHDVIKRKKRKKRKGKRTKNHVKKHHFTHGKTNKNCQKTKKKKHKLKKKKEERNSGFISGDYCSDFSSAELMRLVKEHSHSYSKLPATTSKHPHSGGSSSDEPTRKKRKVSFDKKKQKTVKYHDKHKHVKSKSSKRKKKQPAIQNCPATAKNITDHTMHGKIDTVKDYSRIVQYSSVKKMEAVQIRQRSLALNLSEVAKVSQEPESRNVLVDPCSSNAHLQQFVQQNFESSEDIMKMQLLMAQQQPEMRPIGSNTRDYNQINMSATNQAVLKYVCSKMTSHLLSVAQTSNCVSSDTEGSKTPLPAHTGRTLPSQTSNIQPQNLTANMKQVIIERAGAPYKISSNSTSLASSALVPVSSFSTSSTQDSRNIMGTVFSGGITYPATVTSPQMTTFTIPVSHNPPGGKLVASKIVIPINQCGNVRANIPTSVTLSESNVRTLASTSSSPPISGVIIVKNGNNTQIISGVQPPSSVMPCLPGTRVTLPPNRSKPSPVVTKTVPKMIKQAAKTLSQPTIKKPVVKTICTSKSVPTSTNSEVSHDPVVATSLLSINESDINKVETVPTSTNDALKDEATDLTIAKISSVPQETSKDSSCSLEKSSSPIPDNQPVQEINKHDIDKVEMSSTEICNETNICMDGSPKPFVCSSPVNDTVLSDTEAVTKGLIPLSPKDDKSIKSSESGHEDSNLAKNEAETVLETSLTEKCDKKDDTLSILEEHEANAPVIKDSVPSKMQIEDTKSTSPLHPDKKEDVVSAPVKNPETPKNVKDTITMDRIAAIIEEHKNLPQANEKKPVKTMSARRTNRSPIKAVSLSLSDQEKQLQPISDSETSNGKASPKASSQNKIEGTNKTSDAPTRSFTSISDAVRFSLMDMDDATDSVENQVVLQAFQTSHASSPASPTYAASESGEEHNSASPTSAVMLSAPQSTDATELSVSRVSQRFEPSVHSQTEKFPDCQSTVTRATSWIMEDSIAEATGAVSVQKSPDIDSCGEGKDDDKPKKKRKKKERVDNDITHKFWCQICSKGFFSAYNLRRHCRNVHKMDLPKGSSDNPFANTSQCLPHVQQADTTTSETSSSRLSYGNVQTSCVSPNKGTEYSMLSPTHDAKNQEFPVKSGQHLPQIQTAEFQMQTPPRMASQSSTTHVSPVVPPKDFRHGTPTSVPSAQIPPNKMSPVKSPSQSKFQRLSAGSQVPQMAKISQMQQIALCGQQALQQQRQMGQLQSSNLIQPLPSVACQAQQMQTNQCPHFQANKQIVQQRIGQLQLMHHVAQLPTVPHSAHGIQKPAQNPSYKKCSTNQGSSKISENEQMQQAAQIAQNQQILANQQMQKLIQIRQSAIAASGIASQLSLANAIPNVPGSPVKGATQCFQSQLAAARQAAVVSQIPTAQRAQGTSYNLPSHDTPGHQFFSPGVQPNQEQGSCPHSSFSAQNMSEFSSNTPSYPTIRLSSEANDGLEDLEQFLLENMPWSGEQSSAHGLAQQSGNRPSSADSLTLTIPSQASVASQNRGVTSKGKASISRPKPRKPVTTQCSKNLLGNLGRGVKKKSCSKKNSKTSETECTAKPEVYSQAPLVPQSHELKTFNKDSMGTLPNFPKQTVKNSSVGVLNETDSSDSVQCINVTHNAPPKNAPVGINFNIFSPVGLCTPDKSTELIGNPPSCKEVYDAQRKNSFLDHSNLAATSSLNLDQSKNAMNMNQCQVNPVNIGSAFNPTGKGPTMKPYCPAPVASQYGITNETPNPQDIFLGQRNSETSDSNNSDLKDKVASSNGTSLTANVSETDIQALSIKEPSIEKNLFLGGSSKSSDEKSELLENKEQTNNNSVDSTVPVLEDSNSSVTVDNIELKANLLTNLVEASSNNKELDENNSVVKTSIEKKEDVNLVVNESEDKNNEKNSIAKDNINSSEQEKSKMSKKEVKSKSKNEIVKIKTEKSKEKMAMEKSNLDNNNNNDENIMTNIVENLKKKQTLSSCTEMCDSDAIDTCGTKSKRSTEEKSFLPKLVNHDEHSSQNGILNDENHLPKKNDIENMGSDIGMNRIALRVRKPQDTSNKPIEIDKKVQYFSTEKEDVKKQIVKKNSKKKKIKQENIKNENVISDTKISYKLDGDTKIQKTGLLSNVNKEKDINRSLCMLTTCYDGIKNNNSIENETNGDSFCLDGKQLEETNMDGIPAARLRLRDTPKTSVKRVCPCCVDSKMPKKCRANGGGNIGTKVSNNLKNKSTLKTRNATNGHNGKVNTRSSQRLRSRNNAIS